MGFERTITNPPTLRYFRDDFLRRKCGTSGSRRTNFRGAVRKQNVGSLADVEAIVLETTGEVSVIESVGDGSALGEIAGTSLRDAPGDEQ